MKHKGNIEVQARKLNPLFDLLLTKSMDFGVGESSALQPHSPPKLKKKSLAPCHLLGYTTGLRPALFTLKTSLQLHVKVKLKLRIKNHHVLQCE